MSTLVRVKQKFQITIPETVRKEVRLKEGDLLEATAKKSAIVLTPKTAVARELERAIEEGLRDVRKGRVTPAFRSVKEFKTYLKKRR